ncbi:MAG: hypothetical protein LBJ36_05275 [Synergistaceae bacterium]|jgi:hypothetical protein|nr:hypothetical protein [Synergistaceae bacterium]
MIKKFLVLVFLVGLLAMLAGGVEAAFFNTDIVGQSAVTSFSAMLEALPSPAEVDEGNEVWILTAPDGSARFAWRRDAEDIHAHNASIHDPRICDTRAYDAYIWFDAKPFVDAGLDLSKLPEGLVSGDEIVLGRKLSLEPLVYEREVTPAASFEQIVKLDRDSIGYHAALDHYGITFSEGTLFEWAKDVSKNDKDIVFVLNPDIFLEAGADPSKVEGWTFAKVPVEDARGRKIEADKFLKPFNLK